MLSSEEQLTMEEFEEESAVKKRRLSVEQVKALEKSFELENKLEPERKLKLAQDLRLQPRQVAVWFQNRRARWKTKQLERDYAILNSDYDSLKLSLDTLRRQNEALHHQIADLKSKLRPTTTTQFDGQQQVVNDLTTPNDTFKQQDGSSDSDSSAILNDMSSSSSAHFVKIEEHDFFTGEDACNFFSDDQPPTLHWYCSADDDQWN